MDQARILRVAPELVYSPWNKVDDADLSRLGDSPGS